MMNKQAESKAEVSSTRWQELISVHRTLLDKHCEFFVSHHPSGHRVLMQLPEKYGMPSRLWSYGIQQLLEKFRQRLPESRDRIQDCTRYYMVDFVHLAYAITKLLLEITPVFKVTWMECLGDLARYSMAVEGSDLRKGWTAVSRYWYEQTEGCNPDVGRIQHHLAVARPDVLQQLFYYTKALVCPQPFHKARESIVLLLEPFNDQLLHQPSLTTALSKTHAIIFTKGPTEQFITQANNFMFFFGEQSSRLGLHWRKVVHIMSVNFASVLQYGEPEGVQSGLPRQQNNIFPETHAVALQWYSGAAAASFSGGKSARNNGDTALEIASPVAFQASCLAFHTFAILIKQMGDFKAYPGIHVSMVFIWCLALRPSAMQQVEPLVPWLELTKFLNTLVTDTNLAMVVEGETFPLSNDRTRHLPEDFLIRGHVWSQVYYPEKFFEGPPSEVIKEQEIISVRRQRCLWLGAMIAKVCVMGPHAIRIHGRQSYVPTAQTVDDFKHDRYLRSNPASS